MKFVKNSKERAQNRERRRFLDMIARAGVSTALLKASPFAAGIFASRHAMAQGTNKRAVFMYLPNGAPNGLWMPSSASSMNIATRPYAQAAVTKGMHQGKTAADFCEFREVNMGNGGHGNTHNSMAAYAGSNANTLDTTIANENFPTSIYKIIRAGVQVGGGPSFCREAGQQATHPKRTPEEFYQTIFSGTPPANNSDDSYKRVMEMNRLALSNLQRKLGVDEYERFDTHLASLNEIERSLDAANQPMELGDECKTPGFFETTGHIIEDGKAIGDIVVAALKCGLTNVATIMNSDDQAGWLAGERGLEWGLTNMGLNHHNYSHSGNDTNTANMVALLSEIPAHFIKRLAEETGPDGLPLIDTTVFVQVTDMGDPNHGLASAPFIAASNMSGFGYGTGGGSHTDFMGSLPSRMGLAGDL
ncbi:MAG TPA: DUF1552 domain-containing protein [Marinagarivorans sp.]